MSDDVLLGLILFASFMMWVAVFVFIYIMARYGVKKMYMVKDLTMYGGVITYQGVDFEVEKGAQFKVGMQSVTVMNPNGTTRRFTAGNIFSPQPVITIKR